MKKSNFLLALLTGIVSLILLFGCRNEIDQINNHKESEQNFQSKNRTKIDFNSFRNETKLKNVSSILKIKSKNNTNGKSDVILDVYKIDSVNINKLEFNQNNTYTFRIYHLFENPNNVYNLVYFFKNNNWEYSILKLLENNKNLPIYDSRYGSLSIYEGSDTSRLCVTPYTTYSYHCTGTGSCASGTCDGCGECVSSSSGLMTYDCGGLGGGSGAGNGSNPGSGSNTGGSSSTFSDPSGYIFDPNQTPTIESYYVRASRAYTFWIQLDYNNQLYATQNPEIYQNLIENYLNNYSMSNNNANLNFHNWTLNFLEENPDIIEPENFLSRIYTLENVSVQNPNKLLDIICTELPKWQEIAQHQIPQTVKNKLNNIPNQNSYWSSWNITDLDDGAGARVNMDLFLIKISTMPKKPNGQKYTPAEFFNFFRKNINLFAEKFTPIEDNYYNIHDTALWNSANPLGSLIHINIPIDDGTVICSGFSTNAWIFSTIKAPLGWSYDGIHPVSGNRAFSYYMEGSTMYIYTRGVDRTSYINNDNTPKINYIMEALAFQGADQLWAGMQDKLSTYVNNKGGSSTPVTPVKYRPNYEAIKKYLKGHIPLSSVGCN